MAMKVNVSVFSGKTLNMVHYSDSVVASCYKISSFHMGVLYCSCRKARKEHVRIIRRNKVKTLKGQCVTI